MLKYFYTNNKDLQLLQNAWTAEINPVLAIPQNNGVMLANVELNIGANTINHLLGRQMQGWQVIDQDASASIYRSQPLNSKTLTLTSSAPVTVKLWVF